MPIDKPKPDDPEAALDSIESALAEHCPTYVSGFTPGDSRAQAERIIEGIKLLSRLRLAAAGERDRNYLEKIVLRKRLRHYENTTL